MKGVLPMKLRKLLLVLVCLMLFATSTALMEAEGVTPITWVPSAEHLVIDTEEARALYDRIASRDYPTLEELQNHPVVQQMDALSAYYADLYGDTSEIDTPEREALRQEVLDSFLAIGSARKDHVTESGYVVWKYDGALTRGYQAEVVLGLPASGKSTLVADPDSAELGAFIMDSDVIKGMLPEFQESYGLAANSVHKESRAILKSAIERFVQGDMKGYNVIYPTVGWSVESLFSDFIDVFEAAGYNVKVVFVEAKMNESLARAVMRGLDSGRIIPSNSIIGYGDRPENVYNAIAPMINARGETYGYDVEAALEPAA